MSDETTTTEGNEDAPPRAWWRRLWPWSRAEAPEPEVRDDLADIPIIEAAPPKVARMQIPAHLELTVNAFRSLAKESCSADFHKAGKPANFESADLLESAEASEGHLLGAIITLMLPRRSLQLALFGTQSGCEALTRALYGFPPDLELTESELVDSLGETLNVVAGRVKLQLLETGCPEPPQISLPDFFQGEECLKYQSRAIPIVMQRVVSAAVNEDLNLVVSERTSENLLQEALESLQSAEFSEAADTALNDALSMLVEWNELAASFVPEAHVERMSQCEKVLVSAINGDLDDAEAALAATMSAIEMVLSAVSGSDLDDAESRLLTAAGGLQDDGLLQVELDEEMLDMLQDFIEESTDGLDQVDGCLMKVERGDKDPESIHSLFRAFHSFKGGAALFGLTPLENLAHATETLLSEVREGTLILEGAALASVFESTSLAHQQLEKVIESSMGATDGIAYASIQGIDFHVTVLEAVTRGEEPPKPDASEQDSRSEDAGGMGAVAETVKVQLHTLERMSRLVDELGSLEKRLDTESSEEMLQQFTRVRRHMSYLCTEMQMVNMTRVFRKVGRMARDLARKLDKMVQLQVDGEEMLVPRGVVEALGDPLTHMMRNAIDHGIESREERQSSTKDMLATIRLTARMVDGEVLVEVCDDGRGIDHDRVVARARERGLLSPTEEVDKKRAYLLIFEPGFSTAEKVTGVSGRGVGMDVVKSSVEKCGGRLEVDSTLGSGTQFRLFFPAPQVEEDFLQPAAQENDNDFEIFGIEEEPDNDSGLSRTGEVEFFSVVPAKYHSDHPG